MWMIIDQLSLKFPVWIDFDPTFKIITYIYGITVIAVIVQIFKVFKFANFAVDYFLPTKIHAKINSLGPDYTELDPLYELV